MIIAVTTAGITRNGRGAGLGDGARLLEASTTGLGAASLSAFALAAALLGASVRADGTWEGPYLAGSQPRSIVGHEFLRFVRHGSIAITVAIVLPAAIRLVIPGPGFGVASNPPSIGLALAHLVTVSVLLMLVGSLWLVAGWHLGAPVAAVAGVAAVTATDAVWTHVFADFHQLNVVWSLTPLGGTSLIAGTLRPTVDGSRISSTSVVAIALASAVAASGTVRVPRSASRTSGRRRPTARWTAAAGALLIGAVAPQWLQDGLPWYQAPMWRVDQRLDRAADDVASAFLHAYQRGAVLEADELVAGGTADAVVGVHRRELESVGHPSSVSVVEDPSAPGTVVMHWPSGLVLHFCLTRTSGLWRLETIGAAPCGKGR